MLTNDVVSFEEPGPGIWLKKNQTDESECPDQPVQMYIMVWLSAVCLFISVKSNYSIYLIIRQELSSPKLLQIHVYKSVWVIQIKMLFFSLLKQS